MQTCKNKIYSSILLVIGLITMLISGDGTGFIFLACIAIPMFFSKKNWFE